MSTKFSFKTTLLKRHLYFWQYNYVEYENIISSRDIWNDDRTKMIVLLLFQLAAQLNSLNQYETDIHNNLVHINMYINTALSNWRFWIIDHTKMGFFAFISDRYRITDIQTFETI